jgi:hypothetical protein
LANLLAQLLVGSTLVYKRADCMVEDTSSTSLPAASPTQLTVDGVVLNHGDRALYTNLSTGHNNTVYVATETFTGGSASWFMQEATDGRQASGNNPGGPTKYDVLMVDEGTNAGKLLCWSGTAWTDMSTL